MTEKDRRLIEKALNTHCTDWGEIDPSKADSEYARERLKGIRHTLMREEEISFNEEY